MHYCNWPGCTVKVPFHIYACRPHWFALPSIFRHNISRAWGANDTGAWAEADIAARQWIEQQETAAP